MKPKNIEKAFVIAALILFAIFIGAAILLSFHIVYEAGYKEACKDFYRGKLKYNLVTNSDGTSETYKRIIGPSLVYVTVEKTK